MASSSSEDAWGSQRCTGCDPPGSTCRHGGALLRCGRVETILAKDSSWHIRVACTHPGPWSGRGTLPACACWSAVDDVRRHAQELFSGYISNATPTGNSYGIKATCWLGSDVEATICRPCPLLVTLFRIHKNPRPSSFRLHGWEAPPMRTWGPYWRWRGGEVPCCGAARRAPVWWPGMEISSWDSADRAELVEPRASRRSN
jgi:hypothetical protein